MNEERPHLHPMPEPEPAAMCASCQVTAPGRDMTTIVVVSQFRGHTTTSQPIDLCLACVLQFSTVLNLETTS